VSTVQHDGPVPLRVTCDGEADAAYVHLQTAVPDGGAVVTVRVDVPGGTVHLDLDADGRVLGLEVLAASRRAAERPRCDAAGSVG
jgi:uncharacterized protein YuzE